MDYVKHKNTKIHVSYESYDETLKIAGVGNMPEFGNIDAYHSKYKDMDFDKFQPYSDAEIYFTWQDENGEYKSEYLFGCRVNSLKNLPEGLIGIDTGAKKFAVITFRSETFGQLVGDEHGPGEGMNDAADYYKNVWLPENKDKVEIMSKEHNSMFKMHNGVDWNYCSIIGIYRNTSEENPEMCHFIPLKG